MIAPLRGVQFHGRHIAGRVRPGDPLTLVREPDNPEDQWAIRVCWRGDHLGYIGREVAEKLAPKIDRGAEVSAEFIDLWEVDCVRTNGAIRVHTSTP